MVVTGAVLFLIGIINSFTTANALEQTEIVVEKHINPAFTEKLTNYGLQSGLPPFISNFMQHGTNIFFKPQFMLSPGFVAPDQRMIIESKEDCKRWPMIPTISFEAQQQIITDEPVKIVETVVSDGEPPVVDKIVVIKPSMPLTDLSPNPVFISSLPEPEVNISVSSPLVFSDTPVLPPLPHIPVPVINTFANAFPDSIHAAPELPPLEILQAPVVLDEKVEIPMVEVTQPPVIEEIKPVPIIETSELPSLPVVETLAPSLPLSPVLPAASIPSAPELPPLEVPQPPVVLYEPLEVPAVEISQPAVIEEIKPVLIAEPELPPQPAHETLVHSIPPMPLLPVAFEPEPKPASEPAPYVEVYANHIPLHIPEAPELPPYSPPSLPVPVILTESVRDCNKTPILVQSPTLVPSETPLTEIHSELVEIPEAPFLPEVKQETVIIPQPPVLPYPSVTLTDVIVSHPAPEPNKVDIGPVEIPAAPVLPEFDEYKLPTHAGDHIEIIAMPEAPLSPCVIPEVPVFTPQEPIFIEEIKPAKPLEIPSPPAMSIPELPMSVVLSESIAPEAPFLVEPQPVFKEEAVIQSIEIPSPPVLSPMVPIAFSDVPTLSAIHDLPVIVAETSPFEQEITSNEIPLAEVSESVLPVAIPQGPFLHPAAEIPSNVAVEELSVTNEEEKPVAKPLIIPPAPELPPLSFQPIIEEPKLSQLQISNTPLYVTFAEPPKSSIFLSSPMAPPPLPIIIPQEVELAGKIENPALSKIESIISFPTTCVKNIVIERVLPNIVREGIEVVSSPSPNYPVLSSFSSTIGIRLF